MKAPVVFDLDGTLIDSAPDIHAAVNRMLVDEGLAALDLPTVTSFIGNGLPRLVARVMATCGIADGQHDRLTRATLDHYNAAPAVLTRPYAGVAEALAALAAAGHRLGVCTNKPEAPARTILDALGLMRHLSEVVGGDRLPVNKPDPRPLQACIDALGGGPAVYVGDSEVDAATAIAARVPFAIFTEGYRKSPLTAIPHDTAFADFAELPAIVARLAAA